MYGRRILHLGVVVTLALAFVSSYAVAQQKTLKQQLIGTWDFVRTEATQADGQKILPFGRTQRESIYLLRMVTLLRFRSQKAFPSSYRTAA